MWRYIAKGASITLIHFSFVPLQSLDLVILNNLEDRYEIEYVLSLSSSVELKIFVELLGGKFIKSPFEKLQEVDVSWQISGVLNPVSENVFDSFYQKWLGLTGRDNNMDEYGQLICFNSCVDKLNQATHKVVLQNAI